MELIILGSGTYQPELKRHSSGYLIKIGRQNLVFDFGRGILDQLMKLKVNYYDLSQIFISHNHADHCSELSSFFHISLAEPRGVGEFRKKDITIYGPQGFRQTTNHLLKAFGDYTKFNPRYKVKIKELKDNSKVRGKNWLLQSYFVKHRSHPVETAKSLAFRLESENKILAYSGDSGDCLGLRKACKNADLAIIESSWPKNMVGDGHLTGETAGKIVQESGVKKLILTHLAPYYLKNFNPKKEAKRFYKGPVLIAQDLLKVKL